ncbi:unnamed protein product [Ranitomeya imitator]|uniref:Uncharacterized protein n=1 Tax=Ranitomeya imitator TaxID=111125 RepID=A0ABN9M0K6_9NEOB|nr:unnamed protein product [Ranitomeya imitator]
MARGRLPVPEKPVPEISMSVCPCDTSVCRIRTPWTAAGKQRYTLHWHPIAQRLQFKTLTMTYKAIHNMSPPYICDLVSRYLPTRNLRSYQDLLLYSPLISSSHNRIQDFSRASPYSGTLYPNTSDSRLP